MGFIRFFLAVSVVMAHNGLKLPGIEGHLAVLMFFIISGFYMDLVLNEKYKENTTDFYIARYLRIWPNYIAGFLITAFFVVSTSVPESEITARIYTYFVMSTGLFYDTLYWFGFTPDGTAQFLTSVRGVDGIQPAINLTHMQHMWSVGVELTFYLLAPLFARNFRVTLCVFAVALTTHILLTLNLPGDHPLVRRSPFNFLWLFCYGVICFHLWKKYKHTISDTNIKPYIFSSIGAISALLCIWGAQSFWSTYNGIGADIFLLLFGAVITIVFNYTKNYKFDTAIGDLSYPIYVIHWPIVAYLIVDHRGDLMWTAIIVALSLAAAFSLRHVVEVPVEKIRRRFTGTQIIGGPTPKQPTQ